jgi:hypothetical protein
MNYRLSTCLLVYYIFLLLPSAWCRRIRKDGDPSARAFQVKNLSKVTIDVYWLNLASEDRLLQFTIAPGGMDRLNSHVMHEFEVREQPNKEGVCKGIGISWETQ